MKKVVSFSGGRTSAYLCKVMIDKFGRENVDFVYMDTGAEHPKTYEFIRNVNKHFDLNLTCLRGDFSMPLGKGVGYNIVSIDDIGTDLAPFKGMMSKYGVPYIGGAFCTDRMKLKPYKKYCDDTYGPKNYETWLGIRSDEPKRYLGEKVVKYFNDQEDQDLDCDAFAKLFKAMVENDGDPRGKVDIFDGYWPEPSDFDKSRFFNEWQKAVDIIVDAYENKTKGNLHYMVEISGFEKRDVLEFWSEMPFDLEIEEQLGNCVFCPKKSNLKLAAAQRDEPELYHDFLEMLYSDDVRHDDKTGHWSQMYRGKRSLEQVVAMFDVSTGDEIKSRIRGAKMTDTGSCSESCEVFVCESNQVDMFK